MNWIKLGENYVNLSVVARIEFDGDEAKIVFTMEWPDLTICNPLELTQLRRVLDDASKPNEPRPESMHKPQQRSIAGMDEGGVMSRWEGEMGLRRAIVAECDDCGTKDEQPTHVSDQSAMITMKSRGWTCQERGWHQSDYWRCPSCTKLHAAELASEPKAGE